MPIWWPWIGFVVCVNYFTKMRDQCNYIGAYLEAKLK